MLGVSLASAVLYELYQWYRFKRRARVIQEGPSTRMAACFDLQQHRRFISELLHDEPNAEVSIRGWFKGTLLREIPRPRVLAALRFYISATEDCADPPVWREAERTLALWEQREPALRQLPPFDAAAHDGVRFVVQVSSPRVLLLDAWPLVRRMARC